MDQHDSDKAAEDAAVDRLHERAEATEELQRSREANAGKPFVFEEAAGPVTDGLHEDAVKRFDGGADAAVEERENREDEKREPFGGQHIPPSLRESLGEAKTSIDAAIRQRAQEDLVAHFKYHAPTPAQTVSLGKVRNGGYALARTILDECPGSPEKVIAQQKLREAVMWANAAIVLEGR